MTRYWWRGSRPTTLNEPRLSAATSSEVESFASATSTPWMAALGTGWPKASKTWPASTPSTVGGGPGRLSVGELPPGGLGGTKGVDPAPEAGVAWRREGRLQPAS